MTASVDPLGAVDEAGTGAAADGVDTSDAWLVVIDMQRVFTGDSPWAAPRFAGASAAIERLLPRFRGRTVLTRFVAPAQPTGAWVPYYRDWPFALVPDEDDLYALTEPFTALAAGAMPSTPDTADGPATARATASVTASATVPPVPVVTEPSFGKWGTSLQAVTGTGADTHLVLTGVSTDCCVLSTALAAADAGVRVTVVAEACAGASDVDHARALDAMRLYAPLITVVDTL
ncbi:cysteine hydrolase family protein [Curtobacterium herbarum]|uniref:Isochorismatase family protein n=1 Tax=Curtobacterium herbarum TaxID=150122 RepID=A0ABP4K4H2_9MICO|nr:cysteine hydrolase [Curtobacterium herbarum]MBM7475253.1 nicotinamidase-related amidase [Curtobacterium herbarum]MCS6543169.1 cysteine hydrolase [Curtobacterium herbarum]